MFVSLTGRRPPQWVVFGAAFVAYAMVAVVLTFPLVLHLSSHVPMDLEDSLWYVTILRWNAHVTPLTEQWWNGFAFHPSTGMMAFSDHMLGASLIASPLQWLGAGPITAYNLTFLASFALCAVAAHALAFALTRRHGPAIVCGLAYGFSPYRIGHLPHLELLLAFGMPLALLALHQYIETRRSRWLALFSAALALQALSASYYALFFGVLLVLWMAWFLRPGAWRDVLAIATAGVASVLALWPVIAGYSRVHGAHHLSRDFAEVLAHSADVTSIVTAPAMSALWGWTAPLNGGERQLFPGLTVTALVVVGTVMAWRRIRFTERTTTAWRCAACSATSACLLAVAIGAYATGPWRLDLGWLHLSVSTPYKPLSLALAFALAAAAANPTVRVAWQRRSVLAFYVVAAAVLFLCSLGPRPAFLGEQILYEPPYAWLMRLPLFADGGIPVPTVRVPARFGMLIALALSAAAALAIPKIASSARARRTLLIAAVVGITADAWMRELPLLDPARDIPEPGRDRAGVLMMLPLGDARADTAAMYWSTLNGRPTVNGYHSYAPLSYQLLKLALQDRDVSALDALASTASIVIAADNRGEQSWASFVANHPGSIFLRHDRHWTLFLLPHRPPEPRACEADPVPLAAVFAADSQVSEPRLTDASTATAWTTARAQRVGDSLIVDARRTVNLCEVVLSMGANADSYPRALRVATSRDGIRWDTESVAQLGGAALLAALEDPANPRIAVPLQDRARSTRFVRLEIVRSQPDYPWTVAEVSLHGTADPQLRRTAYLQPPATP